MKRHKLIGYLIVGFGVLMLINGLTRLLSYTVVSALWPILFMLVGILMGSKTGIMLALAGLVAIIARYNLGGTGFGQALQAVVIAGIGLVLIMGFADSKAHE